MAVRTFLGEGRLCECNERQREDADPHEVLQVGGALRPGALSEGGIGRRSGRREIMFWRPTLRHQHGSTGAAAFSIYVACRWTRSAVSRRKTTFKQDPVAQRACVDHSGL